MLYLLYTADLLIALGSITATCANDTAICGSQQSYKSVPAFARKPLLHPEVAKEMEN